MPRLRYVCKMIGFTQESQKFFDLQFFRLLEPNELGVRHPRKGERKKVGGVRHPRKGERKKVASEQKKGTLHLLRPLIKMGIRPPRKKSRKKGRHYNFLLIPRGGEENDACHGQSFQCSSSAPCNTYRNFSRFLDLLYDPFWDLAPKCVYGPNFASILNRNFPMFPAARISKGQFSWEDRCTTYWYKISVIWMWLSIWIQAHIFEFRRHIIEFRRQIFEIWHQNLKILSFR